MTDAAAAKAAIAAVKAAEKAYASSQKKSSAAREKYLELQADTNRKARELAHARTNPDLYDDDPLTVVSPGQNLTGTTEESASIEVVPSPALPAQEVAQAVAEKTAAQPPAPPAPRPAPVEEPDDTALAGGDDGDDSDPWEQVAAPAPAAPAKRRRSKAQQAAAEAIAEQAPAAEPDQGDDDGSYDPPSINAPKAPF